MTAFMSILEQIMAEMKDKPAELLTVEEQNAILVQALLDMLSIYMQFDAPHPDEFGLIAKRTLIRIGRLGG